MKNYTLNINGQLLDLTEPTVMGILNVTPDSFFAESRKQSEHDIAQRAKQIIDEGASFIDVGACSTRPGSTPIDEAGEMDRLRMALPIVREVIDHAASDRSQPIALSIDTFRPDVARMCVEEFGANIINDVSEGDEAMFRMVARMGVAYVLMSIQRDLKTTLLTFAEKVQQLRDFGQKDIILDPGFGFGKTVDENFTFFGEMEKLQVLELPMLVGISRKSMIWKTFACTPDEALNGTTALNALALTKGADILRVHDVKQAVECCRLWKLCSPSSHNN